jgi:hypothetical protein
MAPIIRRAGTTRQPLTAQFGGVFAPSLGLLVMFANRPRCWCPGRTLHDGRYALCRSRRTETHDWPPAVKPDAAWAAHRAFLLQPDQAVADDAHV